MEEGVEEGVEEEILIMTMMMVISWWSAAVDGRTEGDYYNDHVYESFCVLDYCHLSVLDIQHTYFEFWNETHCMIASPEPDIVDFVSVVFALMLCDNKSSMLLLRDNHELILQCLKKAPYQAMKVASSRLMDDKDFLTEAFCIWPYVVLQYLTPQQLDDTDLLFEMASKRGQSFGIRRSRIQTVTRWSRLHTKLIWKLSDKMPTEFWY
jgi:hypothetical protein